MEMKSRRALLIALASGLASMAMAGTVVLVGPTGEIRKNTFISGFALSEAGSLGFLPTGGRIVSARDFDGNGSLDLVLQYDPDGSGPLPKKCFLWLFDGNVRTAEVELGDAPTDFINPAGNGDLDGDGQGQYVLQNPATGAIRAYEVTAAAPFRISETFTLRPGVTTYTRVVGVGDMDRDGDDDIVLQDPATGKLRYRYMNRLAPQKAGSPLGATPNAPVLGVCDARTDGEIIMIDTPGGTVRRKVWFMRNGHRESISAMWDPIYQKWSIVAVAD
jgi:hypothetical protein